MSARHPTGLRSSSAPLAAPRGLAVALLAVTVAACASAREAPEAAVEGAHPALNATVWMQQSVEYEAAARQAYLLAGRALDGALSDGATDALPGASGGGDGDRPPAVVVDVDETVLDNSPFQARLARDGAEFGPDRWNAWVREAEARAVPGALDFLREAARRGVDVYYVTNRDHEVEDATRRNLGALGFPLDAPRDVVLTRGERGWGSDKSARRAAVAGHHRVLLLVGDDLNDFVSVAEAGPDERRAIAAEHEERWGRTWIMLPNPAYGSWERAAYGHATDLSPAERRARMLEGLDPARDEPGSRR